MNFKQQTFITEYLRHRSVFTAYCLAYNVKDASNYDSIMSAANRLLNHLEVNSVITSVLDGVRHEVEQELRAEMKTDMLTIQRKRELLAKIATGETYAVQNYKGKDCNMCVQHVWPTINQMLKAIDLDNKMVGLYTSLHATNKPKATPSLNTQVAEQVDKFLQSMGLTNDNQVNSSLEEEAVTAAPEKSVEMATTAQPSMRPINIVVNELYHNNIADGIQKEVKDKPENSSFEGGAADGGCLLEQEKGTEGQQTKTKLVSPLGG